MLSYNHGASWDFAQVHEPTPHAPDPADLSMADAGTWSAASCCSAADLQGMVQ